jgi:hypothetical protein
MATQKYYAFQLPNTTTAYVDEIPQYSLVGNSVDMENWMKAEFVNDSRYFNARIVFGSGRVALDFRTRTAP